MDGDHVIQQCIDLLFEEFDSVLVTPGNEIFGVKGEHITKLGEGEEAFSCAKDSQVYIK